MNPTKPSVHRSLHTIDWRRYDIPTVLRRQGRGFLERTWKPGELDIELHELSRRELNILVESYGGVYLPSANQKLLRFSDYHWARRCQFQLLKRGIPSLRVGCHLQLQGHWR